MWWLFLLLLLLLIIIIIPHSRCVGFELIFFFRNKQKNSKESESGHRRRHHCLFECKLSFGSSCPRWVATNWWRTKFPASRKVQSARNPIEPYHSLINSPNIGAHTKCRLNLPNWSDRNFWNPEKKTGTSNTNYKTLALMLTNVGTNM